MLIQFLTIGFIQLLAVASPGPDFAVVMTHSLTYSRKIGVLTALGVALGVTIHMSYCLLGFSVLLAHNTLLLELIKYLGASYLVYLGIKALLAKDPKWLPGDKKILNCSGWQALKAGFICNLFNPKAVLYFIAIFTFINKSEHSLIWQSLLCLEIIVIAFSWFTALAFLLTHPKIQTTLHRIQYTITKILGAILVLLAMMVAFAH